MLKKYGLTQTDGKQSLDEVLQFYTQHNESFEDSQKRIRQYDLSDYTPMKLTDMFGGWKASSNLERH